MHFGQRWEEGGASDVSLIPGSPQDLLLTEQAVGVREASTAGRKKEPLLYETFSAYHDSIRSDHTA
jgi:hypothetical protein